MHLERSGIDKLIGAAHTMSELRWLHLSDLHFGKSDGYDVNVVLDALLRDLDSQLGQEFGPVDLVFVTGDIANKGQANEYDLAATFFDRLLAALGVQRDRLFLVPGNHDVDRSKVGAADAHADAINSPGLSSGEHRTKVLQTLGDADCRNLVLRRFGNFRHFVDGYFPAGHLPFVDDYFYSTIVDLAEVRVAIYGLNTTWLSPSGEDRGRMVMGEGQVRAAVQHTAGLPLRIALMHHPLDWLTDWDRDQVEPYLIRNVDFVLHGHRHWQAFRVEARPAGWHAVFASGAGYDRRDLPNSCNAVKLDPTTKRGSAVSLRYFDDSGGFWRREPLDLPPSRTEVFYFNLGMRFVQEETVSEAEVSLPAQYFERIQQSGNLQRVRQEELVEMARQAPKEAIAFLQWAFAQDQASLSGLLTQTSGRLDSALAWDQAAFESYRELLGKLLPSEVQVTTDRASATLLFLGSAGGGFANRLSLQIPKKDPSRPRLAEHLRFSLYLANSPREAIRRPRVTVRISSSFLSYGYQGEPLAIEPSQFWTITKHDSQTYVCVYSAPAEYSSVVEPGKSVGIGTIAFLEPVMHFAP